MEGIRVIGISADKDAEWAVHVKRAGLYESEVAWEVAVICSPGSAGVLGEFMAQAEAHVGHP